MTTDDFCSSACLAKTRSRPPLRGTWVFGPRPTIRRLGENRLISFELPVVASGGRFRSETTFVSDPPGTTISFDEDGTFEFEDAEGEGEGTYGIQGTDVELVVRRYDGPDDKFSIAEPITIQFADALFISFMMGDQRLVKQ